MATRSMQVLSRSFARLAAVAALAVAPVVHAQAVDAEKQKLIDHVLSLWHPENAVIMQAQRPAADTMEKVGIALQTNHVAKEKADKTMKEISTDVQKYVDTVTPIVSASAKKNVGPSVGPLLAQNFSNDELKQLIAMLESPVKGKFEKLVPQMERAVGEKVTADVGPEINKNITTMTQSAGSKLRAAATVN